MRETSAAVRRHASCSSMEPEVSRSSFSRLRICPYAGVVSLAISVGSTRFRTRSETDGSEASAHRSTA